MSRRSHAGAAEALEEIQSGADQLAEWIRAHLVLIGVGLTAVLVLAGGIQLSISASAGREQKASAALASVRAEYLSAMGAPAGAIQVPELANPVAAGRIRGEFAVRYGEVADAHPGTASGTLARLEAGDLRAAAGDVEGAIETWRLLLAEAPDHDGLRGLALQRLAHGHEDAGRWIEAAQRHEEASELPDFPLRHWALADAARCLAAAGERARALALYERVEARAPNLRLPDHQRAQIEALRAAAEG